MNIIESPYITVDIDTITPDRIIGISRLLVEIEDACAVPSSKKTKLLLEAVTHMDALDRASIQALATALTCHFIDTSKYVENSYIKTRTTCILEQGRLKDLINQMLASGADSDILPDNMWFISDVDPMTVIDIFGFHREILEIQTVIETTIFLMKVHAKFNKVPVVSIPTTKSSKVVKFMRAKDNDK